MKNKDKTKNFQIQQTESVLKFKLKINFTHSGLGSFRIRTGPTLSDVRQVQA